MVLTTTRRRVTVAVLIAVALLGLAACGDDDDETTSAGQSATTASVVQTTAAAPATTTTTAPALLKTSTKDPFGMFLTDSTGKTLYIFDRDTSPTSACTGQCATTWPPLLVPAGGATPTAPAGTSGALTVSARSDGSGSQVVWNGKPLYRYSGDVNPGDTNGDGVGGTWHIAKAS